MHGQRKLHIIDDFFNVSLCSEVCRSPNSLYGQFYPPAGTCLSVESGDDNEEEEDDGFEGTPRPMLPYSSMYIFGPTNPYVVCLIM